MQFHDVPRQVLYPTRIPLPTGVTQVIFPDHRIVIALSA
jgi:hypothetical protein